MPHVAFGIPDQYESITRPTHVGIIKQVIAATGMPTNTFIEYAGDAKEVPVHNSFIDSNSGDTGDTDDHLHWMPSRFNYHGKVKVSTQESIEEETLLSSAVHYTENYPLFRDDELKVYLYPAYEKVNVEMQFEYRTKDKNEAIQWRNDMRRRIRIKFLDESFVSTYKFGVSLTAIAFLKQIWELREKQGGYGDTFEDWLIKGLVPNWTVLGNQNASAALLAFHQTQLGILGHFDFTEVPNEEPGDNGITYRIDFTYRFKYERPYFTILKYPNIVHNQMMPEKFRVDRVVYDPTSINNGIGSYSTTVYNRLLSTSYGLAFRNPRGGHIYPHFDDWSPKMQQSNTALLGQYLVQILEHDLRSLLDIPNELSKMGYVYSDEFHRYIRDYRKTIGVRTTSAVIIDVYVDQRRLDPSRWTLNEDLQIVLNEDGDIREVYHVVISLFTELPILQPNAAKDLRSRVVFFNEYLEALSPNIIQNGLGPKSLKGKYIPDKEWFRIIELLAQTSRYWRESGNAPWATVMNTPLIRNK